MRLTLLRLVLLQYLLHNLLLLDQERPHDPILHAIRTPRSSICALYGFFGLGDFGVFTGAESGSLEAPEIKGQQVRLLGTEGGK